MLEPSTSQIEARVALQRIAAERGGQFGHFLAACLARCADETLALRDTAHWIAVFDAQFSFAQQRRPGEILLQVVPPAADRRHARLQLIADELPFLVDSLRIALGDAGSVIDWVLHPVLHLARDEQGRWDELADDGEAEAMVVLECEPLADAAAYAALEAAVRAVLADTRCVVDDYSAMRTAAVALAAALDVPDVAQAAERAEAAALLRWLDDGHFTFLAVAETDLVCDADGRNRFVPRAGSALGLARRERVYHDADALIAPRAELDKYSESPRLVVISKGLRRAAIHHAEFLDIVSVKRLRADGSLAGTTRFIGLFSSDAYMLQPADIPVVRRKAALLLQRAAAAEGSALAKALREILFELPRDELFQSSEDELYATVLGVHALRERSQLKLFVRRDRYGRFFSCLVYLPRERYSRELRDRIAAELLAAFAGSGLDRNTDFLRHGLARIHCIVRTAPGCELRDSIAALEQRLLRATRSWRDELRDLAQAADLPGTALAFTERFARAYQDTTPPTEALRDLRELALLDADPAGLRVRLLVDAGADGSAAPTALKLYAAGQPLPLSDVLPVLENFGLRVLAQELSELRSDAGVHTIQHFRIAVSGRCPLTAAALRANFEDAFTRTWRGEIENDSLHVLVLRAGLDARQIVVLRALTRYLVQTALPYSQDFLEQRLCAYPAIARDLALLFAVRCEPTLDATQRRDREIALAQALDAALDAVATLDDDRVLRAYTALVRAVLRSNLAQRDAQGQAKPYLSIKFDSQRVPELPAPRPLLEIFVYAPQFEGIHLRGGLVARGGLRWSDRRQDYRTEILGLMKAQKVKNAIIVPVGAKGGFVLKQGDPADRERWQALGIAAYRDFLRGLLDLTDNRVDDAVQAPRDVVRHDGDDPYLVVAADKGTAAFSDIANAVAAEYDFWLGDAFASGGSAGYDHKKMGITARGAWEGVKRHFRELGTDIQRTPFTVVGIGDMSGDVFGNGLRLSSQIRLIAAFDHRHIFIDPDPDPARSFAERERLFALPRSSWDDIDRATISAGGGVWPRSAKLITLSAAARQALAIDAEKLTPHELIRAILRAPVDLLFNGGIGTYVKSHLQSHESCGDRANDAVRVDGRELRCRVVGEGGNLGFTQLGRIEYALAGGRINTDFIDNAGGVHTSDREVNIKIALNPLLRSRQLTHAARDPLLAACTDEVAAAVLRDNAVQSLALSLVERDAAAQLGAHGELIRLLERENQLDRAVEFLPDEDGLKERRAQSRGLTRPELAVLLSYSKLSLFDAVLHSGLPDEAGFDAVLLDYFPRSLVAAQPAAFAAHPLRREILATILANAVVNRMGPAFVHRQAAEHGVSRAEVVKAYVIAHGVLDADRYWQPIAALEGVLPAAVLLPMLGRVIGLLRHLTSWLIQQRVTAQPLAAAMTRYAPGMSIVDAGLPAPLPNAYRRAWQHAQQELLAQQVPEPLATALANTLALGSAPDIVDLAEAAGLPLADTAEAYFATGEQLDLLWLLSTIIALPVQNRWQALARSNLREDAYRRHRALVAQALQSPGDSAASRVAGWTQAHAAELRFAAERLRELRALPAQDHATLALAVRSLGDVSRG